MLSEVIHARHSYAAVHLAVQLPHQRSVRFGPLVLETSLLKNRRLQQIGDQPVSRMISTIARCIGLYLHPRGMAELQSLHRNAIKRTTRYRLLEILPIFSACSTHITTCDRRDLIDSFRFRLFSACEILHIF